MTIPNKSPLCTEAAPYIYDALTGFTGPGVPANLKEHIQQCPHCQADIEGLRVALEAPDDPVQAQKDKAVVECLDLHYAYNGMPVSCDEVKAFLPSMSDPLLEIRVPTPITVHIDNCRQCADDLETIRDLQLSHKQLCRLGQVFAEEPATDRAGCAKTHKILSFIARLDLESFPADTLEHLCTCPGCRDLLYEARNVQLDRIVKDQPQETSPCEQISPCEIFDYVIPYGAETKSQEQISSRKSLMFRVLTNPDCMKKVQELHKNIFGILERPASGIVTKFDVRTQAQGDKPASSPYADWPIDVQVSHRVSRSPVKLKSFIRPAAVAAVVLFSLLFYFNFNSPTAVATDLTRIYKAVANIANVHIASFVADKAEPEQEQWVSRTLKIKITKTQAGTVLWDISNSVRVLKNVDTGEVEKTSLQADTIAELGKNIEGSMGLLPFDNISELPADAKWQEVTNMNTTSVADVKMYDLIWTKDLQMFRWRVFVDAKTDLPQRVEFYRKQKVDADYVLKSTLTADYLSQSQMQDIIKNAAF